MCLAITYRREARGERSRWLSRMYVFRTLGVLGTEPWSGYSLGESPMQVLRVPCSPGLITQIHVDRGSI